MSNSNRLFSIIATIVGIIFTVDLYGQNQSIPYIPYNKPTKVYTTEDTKEPIVNNNSSDTIILMKNTVSFHPTLMVDGTVALGYERVFNQRKQAARIILGYGKLDNSVFYDSKIKNLEQVYGEVNYKLFLSRRNKKAPVGLYACPFFQFRQGSYEFEVDTSNYNNVATPVRIKDFKSYSVAGGIMLGYTTIVLEMLTLEAYAGVGQQSVNGDYKITIGKTEYKPLETGFFWNNGPLFKLGVSIGVNF